MEPSYVKKSLALLALAAFAACGGGGATTPVLPSNGAGARPLQSSLLTRIVGVGDSLTAGYQSDGIIGETGVRNPVWNNGIGRPHQIPPNQENGWWALLYEQASGKPLETAINEMYDPATSPLPLIKGPGLDNQIVPTNNSYSPAAQFKGTDPCTYANGFNQAGFLLRGSARVRLNPTSTRIRNFGIPGLTQHEANTIHQPQTDTCSPLPGIPGLLSDVVNEESGTFWPVLRNFTRLANHLTEVNAAASVHPTLATVWLGANDVLKYMGSGGRFVGGNRTAGQVESDLHTTISTLEKAGARVVIVNLPNILETGFFQRVGKPNDNKECAIQTFAWCTLKLAGLDSFLPYFSKKYGLDTPNGCTPTSETSPCGYLTLQGVFLIINYFNTYSGGLANLDCPTPKPNCKAVPGSGLGMNYITPKFAAKVQVLNNVINTGIDNAASTNHVPLVDAFSIFHGLASGDPSNRYFAQAASINPGVCCTLGYTYGLLSLDGIHPSNTGYALIAYDFIATINKAYGTHITQLDIVAAYNGTRCHNKKYCFPDPFAPH
ncbi:MAG: SGNH/GDSL hydrolase family protein [Candidatus Cybelea sp.]